jgi:hypothetical protein
MESQELYIVLQPHMSLAPSLVHLHRQYCIMEISGKMQTERKSTLVWNDSQLYTRFERHLREILTFFQTTRSTTNKTVVSSAVLRRAIRPLTPCRSLTTLFREHGDFLSFPFLFFSVTDPGSGIESPPIASLGGDLVVWKW